MYYTRLVFILPLQVDDLIKQGYASLKEGAADEAVAFAAKAVAIIQAQLTPPGDTAKVLCWN